ncbi:hypothetical protein Tco_1231139 [Tanacetum coccineum]
MPPNEIDMDDLESEDELIYASLVSPFLDSDDESDDESDDGEVLNKLDEYGKAGNFYLNRIINNFDREDLAGLCMIGFRKFVAYFDPFLAMNIITRKAYNTVMVGGLESMGRKLVAISRDVYVFVRNIVMGRTFRAITQLEYNCIKGLILFSRIFNTYIFRMPRTIPRLRNFEWSMVPPILVLSQRDLMSGLRLYLIRRSPGVLRSSMWKILG